MKISIFQVDIHHCLVIERLFVAIPSSKRSFFYFGDGRTFNRRRMVHDGIKIKLLIVHLGLDSRSSIVLQDLLYLYVKTLIHYSFNILGFIENHYPIYIILAHFLYNVLLEDTVCHNIFEHWW